MKHANVIIIGSGIAALQLAKSLRCDMNVIILTKLKMDNSNSFLAQGGIAAAIGKADHYEKHYQDTLEAGRYHNNSDAVRALTHAAPCLVNNLSNEGCLFDKDKNGEFLLGMEGAHSENRIVHGGGDATGKTIMQFMSSHMNTTLEIIENIFVYELLLDKSGNQCIGVKGKYADGRTDTFVADHVVVATGGCGHLYSYSSNAETVTGDGIALAYRAGADITDMEFIQFHPTLLYSKGSAVGLVSEAVRGEGGRLVTDEGQAIMARVHHLGDLAPRHIVSRTIYSYLKKGVQIFLDIANVADFENRFPTITALCEKNDIDLKQNLIPVVPGSHFSMGGIKTDLSGRTNVKGLYAIGEAACTGVHGANRLASNSLLEGLFFGKRLAETINILPVHLPIDFGLTEYVNSKKRSNMLPSVDKIRSSMMDHVGIVRTKEGLIRQQDWLEGFHLEKWMDAKLDHFDINEIAKVFMLTTAWLVTNSALKRTESRGGHYREDFPCEMDNEWLKKEIIQSR